MLSSRSCSRQNPLPSPCTVPPPFVNYAIVREPLVGVVLSSFTDATRLHHSLRPSSLIIGFYILSIIHISSISMLTFELLLLPLAMASSASARLPINQTTPNRHANHTLALPVENDRSAPSPPPNHRTFSNPDVSSPGLDMRNSPGESLEGVHNGNERCHCSMVDLGAGENTKLEAGSAFLSIRFTF